MIMICLLYESRVYVVFDSPQMFQSLKIQKKQKGG